MADRTSGNCCQDAGCASTTYDTIGRWMTVGDGTIADGGTTWIDGSIFLQLFEVDGEVNPASFLTGLEAWKIQFWMRGQATLTIDGVDYSIHTDAQTITVDGVTDSIGISGRHLPSEDLFLFELRVTPSHAYLLGYGNYNVESFFGLHGVNNAYSLLTVDRSADAPDSFSIVWTDAVVGGFRMDESVVALTDSYTTTFTRLCWTQPQTHCPYFIVKKMSRDHMYLDDPAHLRDYSMPDVTVTGWDAWGFHYPGCNGAVVPNWVTGTVLACNDGDDPTELHQTHGMSSWCSFASNYTRWHDSTEDGSYACQILTYGSTPFYGGGGTVDLIWPTPTYAQPYPKPHYTVQFHTGYHAKIQCCWNGYQYECQYNVSSGGQVVTDIAANDLKNGFTLSVSGEKTVDGWSAQEDPRCRFWYDPSVCDYVVDVPPQFAIDQIGVTGGSWTV